MHSTSYATFSVGASGADVAWIVVLVLCVLVMIVPFAFLAAVRWAGRREEDTGR